MLRIPKNVETFSAGQTDLYEAFVDYFRHSTTENYGRTGLNFNKEESLSKKNDDINKLFADEIKRVSGVEWTFGDAVMAKNPNVAWAGFAIVGYLVDMVLPETLVGSIGAYTDIKFGNFGDSFAFDVEPTDLFVVSKAGRNQKHAEVKKQFRGQVTVLPVPRNITVGVSFYKVLAGQESLANFVMKAIRSLESQMTVDSYNAFNTAMASLPASPVNGELLISGYTQDSAVKLAQRVSAYNNSKAVFLGTQVAVSNILPTDGNYRYDLESNYVQLGYIRTAFGYDVMVLPQVADYSDKHKTLLADDKIYVISPSSQKLLMLCIEGETLSNTDGVFDNANLSQLATMTKSYGLAIGTNAIAGLIDLA